MYELLLRMLKDGSKLAADKLPKVLRPFVDTNLRSNPNNIIAFMGFMDSQPSRPGSQYKTHKAVSVEVYSSDSNNPNKETVKVTETRVAYKRSDNGNERLLQNTYVRIINDHSKVKPVITEYLQHYKVDNTSHVKSELEFSKAGVKVVKRANFEQSLEVESHLQSLLDDDQGKVGKSRG